MSDIQLGHISAIWYFRECSTLPFMVDVYGLSTFLRCYSWPGYVWYSVFPSEFYPIQALWLTFDDPFQRCSPPKRFTSVICRTFICINNRYVGMLPWQIWWNHSHECNTFSVLCKKKTVNFPQASMRKTIKSKTPSIQSILRIIEWETGVVSHPGPTSWKPFKIILDHVPPHQIMQMEMVIFNIFARRKFYGNVSLMKMRE